MIKIVVPAVALALLALLVVRRSLVVVCVEGVSMEPTLRDGDRVLVRRARLDQVRRGEVVVLAPPPPAMKDTPWVIKRAVAVPGDPVPRVKVPALRTVHDAQVPPDRLVALGDNAGHSYDSRKAGYFAGSGLLGIVVRKLAATPHS